MLLYTPLPQDLIWEGWDQPRHYRRISFKDKDIVVEQIGIDTVRIIRLLSFAPEDYLNPSLFPGREVNLALH